MMNFIKRHAVFIITLSIACIAVLLAFAHNWFGILNEGKTSDSLELHALFLIAFTAILIWIAYVQLSSLSRTAEVDFLMKLDKRYGGLEIIKARQVIHRFYRQSKEANSSAPEIVHWNEIGKAIDALSRSTKPSEQKEYIFLLNLLDYLESIAFYVNNDYIKKKHVEDMMGISIVFFYTIFLPRIEHRREKYNMKDFYIEFEKLYLKIKDQK